VGSKRWRFATFTVASLLLTSMTLSSFAQMYRYDAATEVTLTGSVKAVSQVMVAARLGRHSPEP